MSASSKKKLRNEQAAAKMTEKQLAEKKEAKKLKIYSIVFGVVIAVMLVIAFWTGVSKAVTNSGIIERSTKALTVGDHTLSSAELNFFYIDSVNNFYNNYGSYAAMFGLDLTKPLNEQYVDEEAGTTWADDFLNSAIENAKTVYALTDAAAANSFTLSEEELAAVDAQLEELEMYATLYGYPDTKTWLKSMYGNGATEKLYREYLELNALADAYYTNYSQSLTYTDADLREAEKDDYSKYSAFSYNSYYVGTNSFLEGGTTDEEGKTTYTDEEKANSVTAAEEAAKALIGDDIVTVEDLDAAIAEMEINAEKEGVASTAYVDTAYSSVNSTIAEWVTDANRKAGDKTYIANTSTSTDEEGNETTTTTGYYVVMFNGSNDNAYPLANVRHILIKPEGGTYDNTTGMTTYTDEEKATAKATAEELLAQWEKGDATEESFAALANEKSADGDGTTGGLYEDVYPGQMVTNFNDWCFAEDRKPGDTGIVESEFGYHIMYYVGDSETTFRDFQITNALISEDTAEWYNALIEAMTVNQLDLSYIPMDLVLSAG